jgi:hypothetical protein
MMLLLTEGLERHPSEVEEVGLQSSSIMVMDHTPYSTGHTRV